MTVNAASGAKLFIGSTAIASNQAEFEADSYIEVGELEDLGEFGDESDNIPFTSLSDSRTRNYKGPRNAGTVSVVVGDDPSDEGQAAMIAAEAQPFDYNFKVQLNDAITLGGEDSLHYFYGKVMSKRHNVGSATNIVRRSFPIQINSAIIDTDPT